MMPAAATRPIVAVVAPAMAPVVLTPVVVIVEPAPVVFTPVIVVEPGMINVARTIPGIVGGVRWVSVPVPVAIPWSIAVAAVFDEATLQWKHTEHEQQQSCQCHEDFALHCPVPLLFRRSC